MRTLGLLGGMTYHATATYYTTINDHVQQQLGGKNSARILLHSFNFADIMTPWAAGDRDAVRQQLCDAAAGLQRGGADAIVLCVNTNHMWADAIERASGLPLLHIIDFSAEAIRRAGLTKIALLGTKVTMEGDFIRGRLEQKFGLEVLLPAEAVRDKMDEFIFQELPHKIVSDACKTLYLDTVKDLVGRGAQGIILGCTELQFVLKPEDVDVPLFDTVALHARGAAQWAIDN
ncbi:aspartate racemase [Apiospora kogelbergensis]|uniref:Aspartate racemase n=1 Tax=Apiospora kogelbergensis TaxID=1337665 RepID=A0AAW0Q4R0_9PEZI